MEERIRELLRQKGIKDPVEIDALIEIILAEMEGKDE